MKKTILASVATAMLSVSVAQATDIGTTISTPCPLGDCAARIDLRYLGEVVVATGTKIDGVEFGGLSGLDYDGASGRFLAISDDRSQLAPARFYELAVEGSAAGLTAVKVERTVTLQDRNGQPFAEKSVDPEAIRLVPGGLLWTSEGDSDALQPPFLRMADRDGRFVREFDLPAGFVPTADKASGIRNNLAFELLAVLPGGDVLAGTEQSLRQDGPISDLLRGGVARLIRYDAATGKAKAQYAYPIPPIPEAPRPATGFADTGLTDAVALDDRSLIAVERSFSQGVGNTVKLVLVDLDGATDISETPSLASPPAPVAPLRKTQLVDLTALGLTPDNIEAIAIGKFADGTEILLLASDNNFNKRQKTQFLAFAIEKRPGAGKP